MNEQERKQNGYNGEITEESPSRSEYFSWINNTNEGSTEAQTLANVYLALDHDLEVIPVLNKIDLPSADPERVAAEIEDVIGLEASDAPRISAKTGMGLDTLKEVFEDMLRDGKVLLKHTFPYEKAGEIQKIRKYGELLKEEYTPEGIYVEAYVPPEL